MTVAHHAQASNPKAGLTLDELGQFVQVCHRLGMDGDSTIQVTVGWSAQVKTVAATGTTVDEPVRAPRPAR